ncbi:MAG: YdcF family protein [Hyphomicrobiaceae bacterium]
MFFVLSKIIYSLIAPSKLCLILIGLGVVLGLWQRWQRLARRLVLGGLLLLLVFGFSPLAKWINKPLDDRFAAVSLPAKQAVTHVILLGGFEQPGIAHGRNRITTNTAAERILAIPLLARRYPAAKIVFSGGNGSLLGEGFNSLKPIENYLIGAGISRERLLIEERSRNTWQNAAFVMQLLEQRQTSCPCGFLLVTSAWHMPRSMGVFRKAGFSEGDRNLYAYPTDFRTRAGRDLWLPFRNLDDGLRLMDQSVKEWIGLAVYWMTGRTAALWPGPVAKADNRKAD